MSLALESASSHVRSLEARLPFRYGIVTLTRVPLQWSFDSLEAEP